MGGEDLTRESVRDPFFEGFAKGLQDTDGQRLCSPGSYSFLINDAAKQ